MFHLKLHHLNTPCDAVVMNADQANAKCRLQRGMHTRLVRRSKFSKHDHWRAEAFQPWEQPPKGFSNTTWGHDQCSNDLRKPPHAAFLHEGIYFAILLPRCLGSPFASNCTCTDF